MTMRRIFAVFIMTAMILIVFSGCKPGDEPSGSTGYPVMVNGVEIKEAPKRVAVFSPSLAEIVVDMGYGSVLFGRTDECDRLEAVSALPSAGSYSDPNPDTIKRWMPDLILTHSALSEQLTKTFSEAGILVVVIEPAKDAGELLTFYRRIGQVFSGSILGPAEGDRFMKKLENRFDDITKAVAPVNTEPKQAIYVADSFGHVVTGDSVPQAIFGAAGLSNAAEHGMEWTASKDQINGAQILFCPEELVKAIKTMDEFKSCPAVINNKIVGIDRRLVERQGLCMAEAAEAMARAAFPEAFTDSIPSED